MKKRKEEKTGATMVDNSRQTHVIKLLGLEEEEENEFSSLERKSRMQNQVRFYRDFYRALCAPECNLEGDKMFLNLIQNDITLTMLFAKGIGRKELYKELNVIFELQRDVGERMCKTIWEELENNSDKISKSDADIEYGQYEWENIVDDGNNIEEFLEKQDVKWKYMMDCYSQILEILLDSEFPLKDVIDRIRKAFKIEKTSYEKIKRNKQASYMFDRDNIYVNLYLYGRGRFIQYFYADLIPDFSLFKDIVNYDYGLPKDSYSLKDVARVYTKMLGKTGEDDYKKIYQNIVKQFQKLHYTSKYREDKKEDKPDDMYTVYNVKWVENTIRNYNIKYAELGEALSVYIFFKRKNYREEDYTEDDLEKVLSLYGKILDLMVKYGKRSKIVNEIKKIGNYYREEYRKIFDRADRDYQESMIERLTEGLLNIYTYGIGGTQGAIYGYSKKEIRKMVSSKRTKKKDNLKHMETFDFGELDLAELLRNIKNDSKAEDKD